VILEPLKERQAVHTSSSKVYMMKRWVAWKSRVPEASKRPKSGPISDEVVYETGPLALSAVPSKEKPARTGPDLQFPWSGRRDSNPRPPPWQGCWDTLFELQRWTAPGREQGVFVPVQPR
jgi:hypothetical protein